MVYRKGEVKNQEKFHFISTIKENPYMDVAQETVQYSMQTF